ncbi:MAG: hypothetical protein ACE14S_12810 [Candidatus Bathyarchaeia archaeon]
MTEKFDETVDKMFPLAFAIAKIKSELAQQIATRIIKEVERSRKLSRDDKDAINRAVDEIVAQLSPESFGISPDWAPESEEEVRQKLIKLRYDANFKEHIVRNVMDKLRSKQSKIDNA